MYVNVFVQGNQFISNFDVINIDIEKRTYKEMAGRFGVSKRHMFFIFVDSNIYPKMLLL
jgi:hypothetical protein